MLQVCADRGDALAVADIEDVYTPFTETQTAYSDVTSRAGTVSQAVEAELWKTDKLITLTDAPTILGFKSKIQYLLTVDFGFHLQ